MGVDVRMTTPDHGAAADAILRVVRRHWPAVVVQNGDDAEPLPRSPDGFLTKPTQRQFFLYQDDAAYQAWTELGAVPENANTMLHVVLGREIGRGAKASSLTLVCDDLTGGMKAMVGEIRDALDDLMSMAGV